MLYCKLLPWCPSSHHSSAIPARIYYFAESLASHLLQRGIPVWLDAKDLKPGVDWGRDLEAALDAAPSFILVASRESLRSENVLKEWRRAHNQGKRIIVARFRGGPLPPELQATELVDFRGAFQPALDELAARLGQGSPLAEAGQWLRRTGFALPLPTWVAVIALMLAVLSLFPFLIADYGEILSKLHNNPAPQVLAYSLIVATIGFFLWHFFLAFLRRSLGMTRLALCFVFFAWASGYPFIQQFGGAAVPEVFSEATMRFVRGYWQVPTFLYFAVALSGVGIVLLMRPEDLLRWVPTGTAWESYRVKHAAIAVADASDTPSRLKQVKLFYLLYDAADAPAAKRLRQELLQAGASEVPTITDHAAAVLLLTNRTRTDWLDAQRDRLQAPLLTVVGTGIRLPESFGWLWRYQWIDLRRWNARQTDHQQRLPQVPEALTRLRVPVPVSRAHHLLCATAALLFAVPQTLKGDIGLNGGIGMLFWFGAILWALLARGLLRRTFSEPQFFRYFMIGIVITITLGLWSMHDFAQAEQDLIRVLPAAAFLMCTPVWLLVRRRDLHFWFPQLYWKRKKRSEPLAPGRNWRTLLWFTLYSFVWISLLNPEIWIAAS